MSVDQLGYDTDVLVVGSGPAGGSMALLLATYGVRVQMITKYGRLADTPRAHITNQRSVEVFRDLGIEDLLQREATPCRADEQHDVLHQPGRPGMGRVPSWGTDPRRHADYPLASPCTHGRRSADNRGADPGLARRRRAGPGSGSTPSTSAHGQDADGVDHDRAGPAHRHRARRPRPSTSSARTARAARSPRTSGCRSRARGRGRPMNIVFEADLSRFVAHRPSVLYWVLQPGADDNGIGLGLLRMVKPWNEWMIIWGYDPAASPPDFIDESIRRPRRQSLVGTDDFEMRVSSARRRGRSTTTSPRRSPKAGCSARATPSTGTRRTTASGSNTSMQDSYNLAWKLAHVIKGLAGASLLDSYDDERAPVARQIVERANKSIADTGRILEALGLSDTSDAKLEERLAVLRAPGQDGEKTRQAMREAIAYKSHEFNAHGMEHNHRYDSGAVVPDGTPMPPFTRDRDLYAQPTTWPGAKLPHAWVTRNGAQVSTLDLGGKGAFTLFTGIGGQVWAEAAAAMSAQLGIELRVVSIGPGQPYEDPFATWADLREIADDGAVLTRPDLYVAYRATTAPASPDEATAQLGGALRAVLGR